MKFRRVMWGIFLVFVFAGAINLVAPEILRGLGWGIWLIVKPWQFDEAKTGMTYSISQFDGDCLLVSVPDPKWIQNVSYKFTRNGAELLSVQGQTSSVFKTLDNKLYFASFSSFSCGCTIYAYDLADGHLLWRNQLQAVGQCRHSAYSNMVNVELGESSLHNSDGRGIIEIDGDESYGQYSEILDLKTGRQLAHEIYRQGFGSGR